MRAKEGALFGLGSQVASLRKGDEIRRTRGGNKWLKERKRKKNSMCEGTRTRESLLHLRV